MNGELKRSNRTFMELKSENIKLEVLSKTF